VIFSPYLEKKITLRKIERLDVASQKSAVLKGGADPSELGGKTIERRELRMFEEALKNSGLDFIEEVRSLCPGDGTAVPESSF